MSAEDDPGAPIKLKEMRSGAKASARVAGTQFMEVSQRVKGLASRVKETVEQRIEKKREEKRMQRAIEQEVEREIPKIKGTATKERIEALIKARERSKTAVEKAAIKAREQRMIKDIKATIKAGGPAGVARKEIFGEFPLIKNIAGLGGAAAKIDTSLRAFDVRGLPSESTIDSFLFGKQLSALGLGDGGGVGVTPAEAQEVAVGDQVLIKNVPVKQFTRTVLVKGQARQVVVSAHQRRVAVLRRDTGGGSRAVTSGDGAKLKSFLGL